MSLNWNKSKYRGETIPLEWAKPGEAIDLGDRVFLDMTAVAPAPSRDYFRLRVTKDLATLTHWKISHGARSGAANETKVNLRDFNVHENESLVGEITRIFGATYVEYIIAISHGRYDWIVTLPTPVLVKIFDYAGIKNLSPIAATCQRFHQVCRSEQFWEVLYRKFRPVNETDLKTRTQARHFSWKNLFLVNRVQDSAFPGKRMQLGATDSSDERRRLQKIKLVTGDQDHDIVSNKSTKNKTRAHQVNPIKLSEEMSDTYRDVSGFEPITQRALEKMKAKNASANMMEGFYGLNSENKPSALELFKQIHTKNYEEFLQKKVRRTRPGTQSLNRRTNQK